MGDDTRLTDARPASDVSSWAKESTKPSYTKSEIGLGNVDNTSDATKKANFTGSVASGDTGFVTGGDVYDAIAGAGAGAVTSVNGKTGAVTLTKSDLSLENVDNTSDATKKTNFTGAIASGNTGFVTGGDVYDAFAAHPGSVASVNGQTGTVVLTKSDIGLGNVDNTADVNKSVAYASNAGTVNNHTVASDVPADAVFTDTTYSNATTSVAGLMSTTDKTKLDGIASGAEVNQNAFSNIKVGSSVVEADSKTDTLELIAGSNITLTPDTTNDKVTISATDTTYESKVAAQGGTDLSLVTTGEKYLWNNSSGGPDDYLVADDAGSAASTNPINADQLNGHPASYFLTSGDIVDGLNSTSTTDALSANQGRILYSDISNLQTAVAGKASASDVTALQSVVAGKANTASPAFTGDATVAASTNYSTAKLRNVILSTSEPTAADGNNGDIWIVYSV